MYATFSTADDLLAFQIFPFEILNIFPGNQEVPGALGELGKVYNIIIRPLVICVDRSFRTHKADVGSSGEDGRHSFVGSEWNSIVSTRHITENRRRLWYCLHLYGFPE